MHSLRTQNPKRMPNICFFVSQHISAAAPTENMQYIQPRFTERLYMRPLQSRIPNRCPKYDFLQSSIFSSSPNRKEELWNKDSPNSCIYVRCNPESQTMSATWFPVSQHISATALIERKHQKTEIHRNTIRVHWNPESQTDAQNINFCKPAYFSSSPNRKYALSNKDIPKNCISVRRNPESQTDAQNMIFCKPASFSSGPNRKYVLQNWVSPKECTRVSWNPESIYAKISYSVNQHILAKAPAEEMHYKTEIHRTFVHASEEIQNSKHMSQIRFSVSQHISAEATIEKMHYLYNRDSPKSFICICWKPEYQTDAQGMFFSKPAYFSRSPTRKYALLNWDSLNICICIRWHTESQTDARIMIYCKPGYFSSSPSRTEAL